MSVRTVIVPAEVSGRLGSLINDKDVVVQVLTLLRRTLTDHAADHQTHRDPEDPDFLFDVLINIRFGGRWRKLRFTVNDTTSPDHFFIEAVSISE